MEDKNTIAERKEKLRQYKKEYNKNYVRKVDCVKFELYPSTDKDIIAKLNEVVANNGYKASYIKQLIREDIERSKNSNL